MQPRDIATRVLFSISFSVKSIGQNGIGTVRISPLLFAVEEVLYSLSIMPAPSVVKQALSKIFEGIDLLSDAVPGKNFTIDGRLVGDIGEALVQRDYDVQLYKKLVPGHDGFTTDGRKVQIKATFKDSLTFRTIPEYYLGVKLFPDGSYEEIYNGPGEDIRKRYCHRKGFGTKLLSFPVSELRILSADIPDSERIPKTV